MEYSKHALAREAMTKAASPSAQTWGQSWNAAKMSPEFLATVAGAGVSLGAGAIMAAGSKLKDMYDRQKSYKEMLEIAPALREKDPTTVKRYFNSLHRMNPHFMNDPSIASALVHRVIESQDSSFGGASQPPTALATMAGELAQGRAHFTAAMKNEGDARQRHWAGGAGKDLGNLVGEGIRATGRELQGKTPAAEQIAELKRIQAGLGPELQRARRVAEGLERRTDAARSRLATRRAAEHAGSDVGSVAAQLADIVNIRP